MMPGPTLLAAASWLVERALNQALAYDPAGRQALTGQLTRPVEIRLTGPARLTLTLQAVGERIMVSTLPPENGALVISGSALALAALALGDEKALRDGRLAVAGDVGLAQQLQATVTALDPDWEAAIAGYTGDVAAHLIGRRIREAVSWSRQATRSLNASLEEYIHEETGFLPGRRELEATFADIDDTSLQVERLDARLTRLEAPDGFPGPAPASEEQP